jgi:DNA-binding PadR family transcriptional regulator
MSMTEKSAPTYQPQFGGVLNAVQRDIIHVLNGAGTLTGRDIFDALDDYYATEITLQRTYRNLNILIEYGYVNKQDIAGRSNNYTLTDTGKRALETHLEWDGGDSDGSGGGA